LVGKGRDWGVNERIILQCITMWSELKCLRTESSDGILWRRQWIFRFNMAANILIIWVTISFSGRALPHGVCYYYMQHISKTFLKYYPHQVVSDKTAFTLSKIHNLFGPFQLAMSDPHMKSVTLLLFACTYDTITYRWHCCLWKKIWYYNLL
jgi:hypothetical protein